jgi:hypothetical protein
MKEGERCLLRDGFRLIALDQYRRVGKLRNVFPSSTRARISAARLSIDCDMRPTLSGSAGSKSFASLMFDVPANVIAANAV